VRVGGDYPLPYGLRSAPVFLTGSVSVDVERLPSMSSIQMVYWFEAIMSRLSQVNETSSCLPVCCRALFVVSRLMPKLSGFLL
jgi:hypothetical protein